MRMIRARRLRDERGIASLMVGVSVVAIFGSAAIAVDLGHLWSSRRHIITATDASALAAASEYALAGDGCATAPGYIGDNDPDASVLACTPYFSGPNSGYVAVTAETPVDYAFASLIGVPDRAVKSSTTASWGLPSGMNGLRPFGLCEDDPNFQSWVGNPSGESAVVRVMYVNDGTECGSAPGNWAVLDLDNVGGVDNNDTKQWVQFGYSGMVRPGHLGGSPGAISNSLNGDLAAVRYERFPIPIFDRVKESGSNSTFHVVGFVGIQLYDWKTTGSEESRYLDLKFVELVGSGECCHNNGTDFGLRVVHICDVDGRFEASQCQ